MNSTVFSCLRPDLQQLGLHELPRLRVERSEWLVHEQNDGICSQCAGKIGALLHASGKFRRIVSFESAEPDELREVFGTLLHRGFVEAPLKFHAVSDVAGDGAPRQQAGVLKDDGSIHAGALNWLAIDGHRAFFKRQQSGDDAHQRCLAAAAGSDDGHELAVANRKRHVDQRRNFAGFAVQPVLLRRRDRFGVSPKGEFRFALLFGFDSGAEQFLEEAFLHETIDDAVIDDGFEVELLHCSCRLRVRLIDDGFDRAGQDVRDTFERVGFGIQVVNAFDVFGILLVVT